MSLSSGRYQLPPYKECCNQKVKLDNPVHCGYMLTFCESEFNTENLSFIIEVDRLRDNMLIDSIQWQHTDWRGIDADFGFHGNFHRDGNISAYKKSGDVDRLHTPQGQQYLSFSDSSKQDTGIWPSKVVDKLQIEESVKRIWDEYIEKNSPSQICLSSPVVERTAFRMKYFHIYGPEVFTEAVEEHMVNTVEVDTLPRFSNSEIYQKMSNLLCALYTSDSLTVPRPPNNVKSSTDNLHNKLFELFEILSDGILYDCLLRYLKELSAERCLLCFRMIIVFENEIEKLQDNYSEEKALLVEQYTWEIYRYFLMGNSDLEIPLSERDRKEIMRNLAKPLRGMFRSLRVVSFEMLEAHFELYTKTEKYLHLNIVLMDALDGQSFSSSRRNKQRNVNKKVGCFNF